ncbi:hypothetical protein BX666DRAFT_1943532 [Dichotomocladium elegans]|nr:hypothetical protein BX666DRAFT_1943532 [Dichotomocladium elegans]
MSSPDASIQDDNLAPEKLDLHDLVEQYRSQPDLLKLILASKVEQDKRKAEEAKLRAKELDVYLHHHNCVAHRRHSQGHKRRLSSTTASSSSSSSSSVSSICSTQNPHPDTHTTYNDSPTHHDAIMDQRRKSAAAAMVALASDDSLSTSYPSPDTFYDDDHGSSHERPRKRREMQAITKIVETREFPYQDNYFWKNNGNTIQKKTGCKSIYYKCSNSNKGCAVNKTVTAKPNGEYLIKYRGQHLLECGLVERVCDL